MALRGDPLVASFEDPLSEAAEVFDQAKLEHARPRPELADGERRHCLECHDEPDQALRIQPAIAVANQLPRQGVDSRRPRQLARCQPREMSMIGGRQVVSNALELGFRDVEVIEQPFGRGGDRLPVVDVVRQGPIDPAQNALVVLECL